jgi:hypothetical protein
LIWLSKFRAPVPQGFEDTRDTVTLAQSEQRPVYPYSVIPGGVMNAAELRESLGKDQLAARHYSDFKVDQTFLTIVHQDRSAYVSYRANGRILWTSYRVRIPAGEKLISDGVHFSRTRCGNRLSEEPQEPTSEVEPTEEAMHYLPPAISDRIIRFPGEMEGPPPLGFDGPETTLPKPPAVEVKNKAASDFAASAFGYPLNSFGALTQPDGSSSPGAAYPITSFSVFPPSVFLTSNLPSPSLPSPAHYSIVPFPAVPYSTVSFPTYPSPTDPFSVSSPSFPSPSSPYLILPSPTGAHPDTPPPDITIGSPPNPNPEQIEAFTPEPGTLMLIVGALTAIPLLRRKIGEKREL